MWYLKLASKRSITINNKLINDEAIIESLMCFKRAGASAIVSYFALDIVKKLNLN